jgi:hypothetical protein
LGTCTLPVPLHFLGDAGMVAAHRNFSPKDRQVYRDGQFDIERFNFDRK